MQVEVKPSQIILKEDLNKVGNIKLTLNFHEDVSAKISIKIRQNSSFVTFPQVVEKSV